MLITLLALAVAQAANPALVTTLRGAAELDSAAAPGAPFVLPEGQKLVLGAGAEAIVLYQGSATRLVGPASFDHAALDKVIAQPAAGAAAVDGLLARKSTDHRAAASRAGGPTVLRPVPAGAVTALGEIRVRCASCDKLEITVHDAISGVDVWTTQAAVGAQREASVAYSGPALVPSTYFLQVNGVDVPFEVVAGDGLRAAHEALGAAAAGLSPAQAASVPAGAWWAAGLVGESLYALDAAVQKHPADADLRALRADYERRAGIATSAQ